LQATSHQGTFSSILQSIATKWNETAKNLQADNPEVTRTVQEMQTSFTSGLQTFFQETQKVGQADVQMLNVYANEQ
jgi:hypothetical protein